MDELILVKGLSLIHSVLVTDLSDTIMLMSDNHNYQNAKFPVLSE